MTDRELLEEIYKTAKENNVLLLQHEEHLKNLEEKYLGLDQLKARVSALEAS